MQLLQFACRVNKTNSKQISLTTLLQKAKREKLRIEKGELKQRNNLMNGVEISLRLCLRNLSEFSSF